MKIMILTLERSSFRVEKTPIKSGETQSISSFKMRLTPEYSTSSSSSLYSAHVLMFFHLISEYI